MGVEHDAPRSQRSPDDAIDEGLEADSVKLERSIQHVVAFTGNEV
jgi:hypothetical protein